jgi:hypothetical protein
VVPRERLGVYSLREAKRRPQAAASSQASQGTKGLGNVHKQTLVMWTDNENGSPLGVTRSTSETEPETNHERITLDAYYHDLWSLQTSFSVRANTNGERTWMT